MAPTPYGQKLGIKPKKPTGLKMPKQLPNQGPGQDTSLRTGPTTRPVGPPGVGTIAPSPGNGRIGGNIQGGTPAGPPLAPTLPPVPVATPPTPHPIVDALPPPAATPPPGPELGPFGQGPNDLGPPGELGPPKIPVDPANQGPKPWDYSKQLEMSMRAQNTIDPVLQQGGMGGDRSLGVPINFAGGKPQFPSPLHEQAWKALPPRLQQAVQAGKMSLGGALLRQKAFDRQELPGQRPTTPPPAR